jgi:hypothetical protein
MVIDDPEARVTVKLVALTVMDCTEALEPEMFKVMPFTEMMAAVVRVTSLPAAKTTMGATRRNMAMIDIFMLFNMKQSRSNRWGSVNMLNREQI